MSKLRVAQVTNLMESVPPLFQHGLEQLVYYLTEELVRQGLEVTLYATADSKTSAKLVPVWPEATMRHPSIPHLTDESFAVWSMSEALAHRREYDVIHDHTRFVSGHLAGAIETPVVTTLHHPVAFERELEEVIPERDREFYHQFWSRQQAKAHVVVVSEFQAKEFEKLYGTRPQVIHNGIEMPTVKDVSGGGDYLVFLGYITANKGVAEAIAIARQAGEKLVIAGPLDDTPVNQEYYKTKIAPFVDGEKIKYIGPVSGQAKWDLLAGAKATLMPVQWDEPFGLVAVESLAVGTPVVATRRGALPEIVDDSSGFIVDSSEEMVGKIAEIKNIDRVNCRKRMEEKFTAKIMTQKYIDFYQSLVK